MPHKIFGLKNDQTLVQLHNGVMDLICNDVKNKNGGYTWGTFVQKIV